MPEPKNVKENREKFGSYLYDVPDNWFGPWNDFALDEPVARHFLQFLIQKSKSSTNLSWASICCEIALITNRNPKTIIQVLAGAEIKEKISLKKSDSGNWELSFNIINHKDFAETGDMNVTSRIHLKLPLQVGDRIEQALERTKQPKTSDEFNELMDTQNEELIEFLVLARGNVHPSIYQNKVSMTFAKTHFHRYFDIPLLQMITSYDFKLSPYSLNYLYFDESFLQRNFQETLQDLFPDTYTFPPCQDKKHFVGAPKARQCHSQLTEALSIIQKAGKTYRPRDKATSEKWCDYHQSKCQYTAIFLAAQIGHRVTKAFNNITLKDIDLETGLIIFGDKHTTVSERRRIAALGQIGINALRDYLKHLHALRKKAETSFGSKTKQTIITAINNALSGQAPLFFSWSKPTRITAFQITRTWNEHFSNNSEKNRFRHALANELRTHEVPGVFIEAHLGHFHGIDLFGEISSISPSDFARALAPALDKIFAPLSKAPRSEAQITLPELALTPKTIFSSFQKEKEADKDFIKEQEQKKKKASVVDFRPLGLKDSVEQALKENIEDYTHDNPPKSISLTTDQISQITKDAIAKSKSNNRNRIFRRLKRRLQELKAGNDWYLPIGYGQFFQDSKPFPVYQAHLLATYWRQQVINQLQVSRSNQLENSLALMILAGAFENEDEFDQVVEVLQTQEFYIIDNQTISLDLGDLNQSFCAVGQVAICLLCAKCAIGSLTEIKNLKENIWNILPSNLSDPWSSNTFGHLIESSLMANRLTMPPIIHFARSQGFTHRTLPSERLAAFLYPETHIALPQVIEVKQKETRIPSFYIEHLSKDPLKRELLKLIRDPDQIECPSLQVDTKKLHNGHKKVHLKLLSWRAYRKLPPELELLADWADRLLAPNANKKTGKMLAIGTIVNYIRDSYETIKELMDNHAISEATPEDVQKIIDAFLVNDKPFHDVNETKRRVTRCINEAGNGRIPKIVENFSYNKSLNTNIHADVITDSEKGLMIDTLEYWTKDQKLTPPQINALLGLRFLLTLISDHGMRISEATWLKVADIKINHNLQTIFIRNNSNRSLKTKASTRILTCHENMIPDAESFIRHIQGAQKVWLGELASDLIKLSSSATKPRLHLFRHTKASKFFLESFISNDAPLQRAERLELGRSKLGHASLISTARFYSHVNQFIEAHQLSRFHQGMNYDLVGKLMGRKRPPRDFELTEAPAKIDIFPLISKRMVKRASASRLTTRTPRRLPPLTRYPKVENVDHLMHRFLFYKLCMNELEAFQEQGDVPAEVIQNFLNEVTRLAKITGFYPVSEDQIKYHLTGSKINKSEDDKPKFKRSRLIDQFALEDWYDVQVDLTTAQSLEAMHKVYDVCEHISKQWQANSSEIIITNIGYNAAQLKDYLQNCGVALVIKTKPGQYNNLIIKTSSTMDEKQKAKTLRLLLFGIILDYRLRVLPKSANLYINVGR